MPSIPLFGQTGTLGLGGIQQGYALQANQLALQQQVRDNARDYIDFASQLDGLAQFADARRSGLTPQEALFRQSQTSFNPLSAQSGLNNFTNRAGQLAPFAIEQARGGDTRLFNQLNVGQFDASNPTAGFGALGAEGIGAQTRFNVANNAVGGQLSNVPQQAPIQQFFGSQPQQQPQPQQQQQFQQPVVRQQTQIQLNNEAITRAVQEATRTQNGNLFNSNLNQARTRNATFDNPQSQRQEAVSFPTVNPQATANRDRRRRATSFTDIYNF